MAGSSGPGTVAGRSGSAGVPGSGSIGVTGESGTIGVAGSVGCGTSMTLPVVAAESGCMRLAYPGRGRLYRPRARTSRRPRAGSSAISERVSDSPARSSVSPTSTGIIESWSSAIV